MASFSIAVIDDDAEFRQSVSATAQICGYETYATTNPDAFERYVAREHPSLAMLELAMHELDGIVLMDRLALLRVETPLIIVTQVDDCILQVARRLAEARGLCILGALHKPLPAAVLCALLATARASCLRCLGGGTMAASEGRARAASVPDSGMAKR